MVKKLLLVFGVLAAPSLFAHSVGVNGTPAVITAITPATFVSGVTTPVVITGSGFVAGAALKAGYPPASFATTFVSDQELHANVFFFTSAGSHVDLYVVNPSANDSNPYIVTVTPAPPPPPADITFSGNDVIGNVTPGSTAYWLEAGRVPANGASVAVYHDSVTADTDGDGVVHWMQSDPPPAFSMWAFVDSTGKYALVGPGGYETVDLSSAVQLGPDGKLSRLVVPRGQDEHVLWVRPGSGAWRLDMKDSFASDHDVPGFVNGRVIAWASDFGPLQSTLPAPASFADGDVLITMSGLTLGAGIVRLSNPAPTPGPGVMEVNLPGHALDGTPMLIWLYRGGGADGTVTVDYATADATAIAGVDYQPASGTITFGTGEYLKSISIPTLNDGLFAGVRQIAVTLTPHGTTIKNGQTSFLANLYDSDPIPLLTMTPVTVLEGDASLHYADMPVTRSGATRATATATATWSGQGVDLVAPFSGTITFTPGESVKNIRVGYRGNTTPGPDRTITLYLQGDENAMAATSPITIRIQDDDLPRLSVADASLLEGTSGSASTMTFHVALLEAGVKPVTVDYATVDGTARAGSDYTSTTGTLTFAPGELSKLVSVPITPDARPEANETFVLRLTNPAGATFARDSGVGTILDDDGPVPADAVVSIDDVSVPEGNVDSFVAFTVTLAPARTDSVTVNFQTVSGTADSSDYTPTTGAIVFGPGQTTQKIFIPIRGDLTPEPDETFDLVLTTNAEGVTLARDHATCTLRDDDTPAGVPVLRVADITLLETNGPTTAVFTVTLSQPVAADVTVQYFTADGTASAPDDYVAVSGTLTIPAGSTEGTIAVAINGDILHEGDETFHLHLSNASVAIATPSATATIVDDDPLPMPKRRGARH